MQIPNAHLDARAPYRDRGVPSKLVVKMVAAKDPLEMISDSVRSDPMPAVVITKSSKVWQMTAGGSGLIWVQGSGRLSADQRDALDEVLEAFQTEWPELAAPKIPGAPKSVENEPEVEVEAESTE